MSVPCPVCGEGVAPGPDGKCSDCANRSAVEWMRGRREPVAHRQETTEARRARLARMGDADYRRAREGDQQ